MVIGIINTHFSSSLSNQVFSFLLKSMIHQKNPIQINNFIPENEIEKVFYEQNQTNKQTKSDLIYL